MTSDQWACLSADSDRLGEGGLFGRAGALFTVVSAGKGAISGKGHYRVGERGEGVGCNSGGAGVFWVGLGRVRGADDQPSLSRSFYRDRWFWGNMGFIYL